MRIKALELDARTALAILVASVLTIGACAGTQKPSCNEQKMLKQLAAIEELHEKAALGAIAAGECDEYKGKPVTACPAYMAIETSFRIAAQGVKESCQ